MSEMRMVKILCRILLFALLIGVFICPADASDRIRMGVLTFGSKASGVSDQQADSISDIFVRAMASSNSISLFERQQLDSLAAEIRMGQSGLVDVETAVEVGRIKGLQYILLGSVTELSGKVSGGGGTVPLMPIPIGVGGGSQVAKATIDMRVIDVATSEVRLAFSETGMSTNSSSNFSVYGLNFTETEFGGLEARAIADATFRLAYRICNEMGGEYAHVLSSSGGDYIIDIGSSRGVQDGMLFLAYAEGRQILGLDGSVLAHDKIPLAVLKVKNAESAHSVCTVAPPTKGSLIQRGDKIEPISSAESKNIKSPSSRPASSASDATFSQLFGNESGVVPPVEQETLNEPEPPAPSEAPAAQQPAPASPTPPQQPSAAPSRTASSYSMREVAGVDPDNTTDAKLIDAYDFLDPQARNTLGIQHRGAWQMYSNKQYKDAFEIFTKLADDYAGNYLSAYWAGMCAVRLNSGKEASKWFNQVLEINPNYQPAIDALAKLGDEPANKPAKKR